MIEKCTAFCLSRLIHRGSFPTSSCVHKGKDGGIQLPTTVGTDDPSIWQHWLLVDGQLWTATLKCELTNHRPGYDELRLHFEYWRTKSCSPWKLFEK